MRMEDQDVILIIILGDLAKLLLGGSGFWQAEPWGLFGARQVVGYREDLKRGV